MNASHLRFLTGLFPQINEQRKDRARQDAENASLSSADAAVPPVPPLPLILLSSGNMGAALDEARASNVKTRNVDLLYHCDELCTWMLAPDPSLGVITYVKALLVQKQWEAIGLGTRHSGSVTFPSFYFSFLSVL